ncbi:hypothetical protein AERYTH_01375 [Aeromicrobium erythreum]|uniref:Uncharacterized protein n=1 Tax=Aeromicrobium erythreum TaxID=2041 RepID=A0A0U3KEK9_9ACTN|nr:hypothetical protein AERYTH_01375 [Aeromicrobium erythreum]
MAHDLWQFGQFVDDEPIVSVHGSSDGVGQRSRNVVSMGTFRGLAGQQELRRVGQFEEFWLDSNAKVNSPIRSPLPR